MKPWLKPLPHSHLSCAYFHKSVHIFTAVRQFVRALLLFKTARLHDNLNPVHLFTRTSANSTRTLRAATISSVGSCASTQRGGSYVRVRSSRKCNWFGLRGIGWPSGRRSKQKKRSCWVHPLNEKRDTLSACKTTLEELSLYPKRFKPNTFLKATLNNRLLLQPRIYSWGFISR